MDDLNDPKISAYKPQRRLSSGCDHAGEDVCGFAEAAANLG